VIRLWHGIILASAATVCVAMSVRPGSRVDNASPSVCPPYLIERRDVQVGEPWPKDLEAPRSEWVLFIPDCKGCGSDIRLMESAVEARGKKNVSVLVSERNQTKFDSDGWASFRRYSSEKDFRPVLIRVHEGRIVELYRDPKKFPRGEAS
jgi:hypothetical protein